MSKMSVHKVRRASQMFQPILTTMLKPSQKPKVTSKSYDSLIKYGFIKSVNNGMYAYLPLGLRVLDKLTNLVVNEMENVGAQKLMLPALTPTKLWKQTNRFDDNKTELFEVHDRHKKNYILSPTYEETICDLIASTGTLSPKILPLKLYQISNKWRDEMKPRLGFFRSREFVMKDLYTFDASLDDAKKTYELICEAYDNIFKQIGISYVKAIGDTGSIGGLMSHEYHYKCEVGDDTICMCSSCQYAINKTVCKESHCPECNSTFLEQNTAEVGHAFLLDTKYTEPLKAQCHIQNKHVPSVMGCFGLGLSRILTVMAETLSTEDELRWPKNLAPYTVCIIPPKAGSKEEIAAQYIDKIVEILNQLNIDAILDDRTYLTIGNRFKHSCLTGYPYIIVIGKTATNSPPTFEVHNINDSSKSDLSLEAIHGYFNAENIKS
ncbi:prolyl-tRNA synthetase 2-like protein, mitochondrial isoform X1 [Lasioglossum baleicum]|uniref:prolyl-tRNA synthetase 2-like protein, mitochondrial isoform X1 n=2 Tax=Lasioglossum baleicum TaxID=434251 RepID=UPI003FCCDD2D